MGKSIIIIPSRLAATRLPNKPLIKINNKTLIMHVYEKALKSGVGEVYVATCDTKIAIEVEKNGGKFVMTNSLHTTGTDRIFEAFKKLDLKNIDFILNVQGDEPMINPNDIKNLHDISKEKKLGISTLAFEINNKDHYHDENIVKVITKKKITNSSISEAITFERKIKKDSRYNVYHHYGIYLYKTKILEKFINLTKTKNETEKKLEQLRALDNEIKINVLLANNFSSGIDTQEDLLEYKKILNKEVG